MTVTVSTLLGWSMEQWGHAAAWFALVHKHLPAPWRGIGVAEEIKTSWRLLRYDEPGALLQVAPGWYLYHEILMHDDPLPLPPSELYLRNQAYAARLWVACAQSLYQRYL